MILLSAAEQSIMDEVLIKSNSKRINGIDATRGLVMIIMALDHVRDFMHVTSLSQDPTNLHTTTTALFITRWVTHLCAPTFVFLSGVSAYISYQKTPNRAKQVFLLRRGLFLVVLDLTVINFASWFDIYFRTLIMEVVSAIGIGFIVLSLIIKMPPRTIGLIGLVIIFGHNLLQGLTFKGNPVQGFLFSVLFRQGLFMATPNFAFITAYPLVPWVGIILAGFGFGPLFAQPLGIRRKKYLQIGGTVLILFLCLRLTNIYGDPLLWSVQKNTLFTIMSIINVTKYPPSLLFTLLMLGIMLVVLWLTDGRKNKVIDILCIYGKVPLFYFVVHLYLIHLMMLAIVFVQGFSFQDFQFGILSNGRPKNSGVDLGQVYLIWIGILIVMFPLCKWYGKYKANHQGKSILRYL